jgi:hypothetical protein
MKLLAFLILVDAADRQNAVADFADSECLQIALHRAHRGKL